MTEIPPRSSYLPFLEVRDSQIHGEGVFTTQPIDEGDVVIVWGGLVLSHKDFYAGDGLRHTNVGIDEGVFLAERPGEELTLDDYMNHSCEPNLWLVDEVTLVAKRNIEPREELTIDYAIELSDENYVMSHPCNCGAKKCRRIVTGKDWRLPEVQRVNQGHFSPFINRRIEHLRERE